MGYQEDQRLPSERAEQEQQAEQRPPPPAYTPALPPREPSISELRIHANTEPSDDSNRLSADIPRLDKAEFTWSSHDPRNASTDSLLAEGSRHGRRKLLLIFIHGFMGNETSFQSFPAHVHGLVTDLMTETHVVHTKIYPRYKSRRAIEFARDEFSEWLRPHEGPDTDVLLLGHSMGGILSAEVVLKPSISTTNSPFEHRILGTINFDVPFLGMHPGVVTSGIGSLFRPGDKSSGPTSPKGDEVMMPMPSGSHDLGQSPDNSNLLKQSSTTSLDRASRSMSPLPLPVGDPNYNPNFENDIVRPARKGWEGALHFMTKHSGSLRQAAKAYVTSHVEFGGTMADYPKLHARYKRLRALEDIKDRDRARNQGSGLPRVRFVNFYTASTGVPKRPKSPKSPAADDRGRQLDPKEIAQPGSQSQLSVSSASSVRTPSPRISIENPEGTQLSIEDDEAVADNMSSLDPKPLSDTEETEATSTPAVAAKTTLPEAEEDGLPPLPPIPTEPETPDLTSTTDKDILKIMQKDHARKLKLYNTQVKDREKAIGDRKKVLEKRQKRAAKEQAKATKEAERLAAKQAKERDAAMAKANTNTASSTTSTSGVTLTPQQSTSTSLYTTTSSSTTTTKQQQQQEQEETPTSQASQKKRDRKFCITPSKTNGVRDATWVRVFMEGVDEVGAHCGLFFEDKGHYEGLVRDVGDVVREWVCGLSRVGR